MHILFLGDSITDCGHCFTTDNLGDGFVRIISDAIKDSAIHCDITNAGSDGFTFPSIFRKWDTQYSENHYDLVVINGGINDIAVACDTMLSPRSSEKHLKISLSALRKLLSTLIEREAKIILILPFLFHKPAYLQTWMPCLLQFQEQITELAAKFSEDSLHILDLHAFLNERNDSSEASPLTTDGIHPSYAGHVLLAEKILNDSFFGQLII